MYFSYLKLAFRLLLRNPYLTTINLACLSIGFAVFHILWTYSATELNSDRFHANFNLIYRFALDFRFTADSRNWNNIKIGFNGPLPAKLVADNHQEIASFVRIFNQPNYSHEYVPLHENQLEISVAKGTDTLSFVETQTAYADPNLFEFFGILLVKETASGLNTPESVAISEVIARKYFGEEDPIGQEIIVNNSLKFRVSSVFEDLPINTHLQFNIVFSLLKLDPYIQKVAYSQGGPHCYFKVKPGTDITLLENSINSKIDEYYQSMPFLPPNISFKTFLQPCAEVSFNPLSYDMFPRKDKFSLISLRVISIFILIMVWANHILSVLSTKRGRAKEYLVRKSAGANFSNFFAQYFSESLLTYILATLMALTLLQVVKVPATKWFDFHFPLSIDQYSFESLTILIVVFIAASFLGLFALYRINWRYNINPLNFGGRWQLKVLPIIQFTICTILIIWLTAFLKQTKHLVNRKLGFNKSEVVTIDLPIVQDHSFKEKLNALKNKILQLEDIIELTVSNSVPGDDTFEMLTLDQPTTGVTASFDSSGGVDSRFITCLNISLIAGQQFTGNESVDRDAIIVSKRAAERLGFKTLTSAIGQKMKLHFGLDSVGNTMDVRIIGVIADYFNDPLEVTKQDEWDGVVLTSMNRLFKAKRISIRISMDRFNDTITSIEREYKAVFKNSFQWHFLEEHVNRHYLSEIKRRNQVLLFTALAILIACLGLLAIISNRIFEKTKEISIRKITGASVLQLGLVLLRTTIYQIVIAIITGIPIAYYLNERYLNRFSEHVTLSFFDFIMPVMILLCILAATIAYVLIKAVNINPVRTLQYE